MKLYRSIIGKKPYTGSGSFWSPDPDTALKYGRRGGRLIVTNAQGRALKLESDDELIEALTRIGVVDAEDRVLNADWLEADVFEALQYQGINWIVRLIDPSVSLHEVEWIYVGREALEYS